MNLLVTNTHNAQAYAIIRALRPHARKIVATMEGPNRFVARFSHAANSCLVDRRYYVPSPTDDWRAGRIQRENTKREAAYIDAVQSICEQEKIDTIFPSFDPHVYVFSKNKERFEKFGVLIPVPDYETVVISLDKYRTIQAAGEVGFPCPKTYLAENDDNLRRIAGEVGFPCVVKPRFSAGGRGFALVRDWGDLCEKMRLAKTSGQELMVQEYIPGKLKAACHIVLDKQGSLKLAFHTMTLRNFTRAEFSTVAETRAANGSVSHAVTLVQRIGWWGSATVQMKVDSRTNVPKLMEINPRPGIRLWQRTELGINEPLICLKISRGEKINPVKKYSEPTTFIEPIEDLLGLGYKLIDVLVYRFRVALSINPIDPFYFPVNVIELIKEYRETYCQGKNRVYNPYFKYFVDDPLVSILWWMQFLGLALRYANQLGK